jgi:hypothetical protein
MTPAHLIHRARERLFSAANFLLLQAEKVVLSFEAESKDDLAQLVSSYATRAPARRHGWGDRRHPIPSG